MCLAIPGKIMTIEELNGVKMANVNFGGAHRNVCIEWIPEARIGDYVLAHVGVALTLMDEQSAHESLAAFQQIASQLKEEDINL